MDFLRSNTDLILYRKDIRMGKNIIIVYSLVVLSLILLGCTAESNWQSIFRHNIIEPIPQSVSDFKYQKDASAMHGAIIFLFKACKSDVDLIITKRNLDRFLNYEQLPEFVKDILKDKFKNVSWWHPVELESMDIFGLTWRSGREPHVLVIFVGKEDVGYGMLI